MGLCFEWLPFFNDSSGLKNIELTTFIPSLSRIFIIDLIIAGLNEGNPSVTYEIVSLEVEAIKHAISLAEEGTYIVALSDVVDNAIDIVQSYLDAEIEEEQLSPAL